VEEARGETALLRVENALVEGCGVLFFVGGVVFVGPVVEVVVEDLVSLSCATKCQW